MDLFSYITARGNHPKLESVLSVADAKTFPLLFAVIFPVLCACAVFLCLRKASLKRKLFSYFCALPFFIFPTIFIFPELTDVFASLLGDEFTDVIPDETGFALSAAFGIIYLGVTTVICSGRVMKTWGIITQFLSTVVFAGFEFVVTYFTAVSLTGTNNAHTIGGTLPFLNYTEVPKFVRETSVNTLVCIIAAFYLPLFFICFIANRRSADLKVEDIVMLHRIEEKEKLIEKEGVCAVCRYSVPLDGDKMSVKCDFKGVIGSDGRCHRFEYDPLKREPDLPEKHK